MRARNVLLTHFSQRYPKAAPLKLSPWSPTPEGRQQAVGLALDLVSIKIGEMWKLALYQDAVGALFDELGEEGEEGEDEKVEGSVKGSVKGGSKGKKEGKSSAGPARKEKGTVEEWKEKQKVKEKQKGAKEAATIS